MSDNREEINRQLVEVVGAIKELTNEIKHLVKSHDETRDTVKEHEIRIRSVETDMPLLKEQRENQKAIKIGLWIATFSGICTLFTGLLIFFLGDK